MIRRGYQEYGWEKGKSDDVIIDQGPLGVPCFRA